MKKKVIAVLCATMTLCLLGCNNASNSSSKVNEEVVSVPEEDVPESLLDSDTKYVFGTATLTYAEFYLGDVSSTETYDGVSSATTNKYEIFPNMDTDYVDETKNAKGYHINGIKNVNVAVPADEVDVYKGINSTFEKSENQVIKYVTFINQNDTYVYEFDGIYVKPVFRDTDVTAEIRESEETVLIANIPEGLENAAVTVTYIVGEGREAVRTVVYEGVLDESLTLDGAALKEGKQSGQEGSYTVVISSDNYANIAAKVK